MKNIFFTAMICFTASNVSYAQTDSIYSEPRWVLDFGGSVGFFAPFDQFNERKFLAGVSSTTSLQFNYKKHFFTRLEFGEVSAGYRYHSMLGPVISDINSTTNSINIGLGFGYQYKVGQWQPFIYTGAGPSLVFIPATTYEAGSNTLAYKTNASVKMHMNAGAGVNYYLSRSIILLIEAKTFSVPNLPKNPSPNLSGIAVLVNIKITL